MISRATIVATGGRSCGISVPSERLMMSAPASKACSMAMATSTSEPMPFWPIARRTSTVACGATCRTTPATKVP